MSGYVPSLGQFVNAPGTWDVFEMPEYAQAMFEAVRAEIARVYWNREQSEWEEFEDPGIPGMVWRCYYWGDDDQEAGLPNFTFGEVEVRWYKYAGRGMSTNRDWSPAEWAGWFDRCMAAVRGSETAL